MALRFSLTERAAGSIACPGAGGQVKAEGDALQFIKQTLDAVHNPEGPINWALLGYKGTSTDEVELIGSGTGGSQELLQHLNDDIVAYGLVRVVDVVDGIPTNRFAYINWVGDRVPGARKARIAVNKTSINEIIGHYNVEFLASSKDELAEDVIRNKIQDASGSRNRVQETVKPVERVTGRGGGGRTIVPSTGASSSLVPDELKQYLADVRNDATATNWALFSYDNLKAPKQLVYLASGNGDITELVSHLDDSQVHYGLLRVTDQIDASVTTKFIYINWVGTGVGPMVKGKLTTHKGTVEAFFEPYTISLFGTTKEDLTPAVIADKIQHLKGR